MSGIDIGWRLASMGLAWLLGTTLHLQERTLMPSGAYEVAVLLGILSCALAWRLPRLFGLALVGMLLLGAGVSGWQASMRWADSLAPAHEGQDLQVTGVVDGLPQLSATGWRFRFQIDQALLDGTPVVVPKLVSLGWYNASHGGDQPATHASDLRAGQRWHLTVRLRQPHGSLNPHGFDYELYLFEQGIRATGYVRARVNAPPEMLQTSAGHWIDSARQHIRDAIFAQVADARAAGVMAALSVGDQSAIERDDWQLFRTTGVAHLMSISGLHVTMFAWAAGLILMAIWRRSSRALLTIPAPTIARWGGLLAAVAYAIFSGWGVPAQRTVWMLVSVTLLQSTGRHWPWPLVLLAAAVVVTALDPWALLQPGFWLSFMAVGLLMASQPMQAMVTQVAQPLQGWRAAIGPLLARMRGGLRTQLIATLGLTPLTLVFFQQVSLVGFIANLVAIPLVTLLITPLALLGVVAAPLWSVGAWLQSALTRGLSELAAIPVAVWSVPVAPPWAQAVGLIAASIAMLPLPWRLRVLAVPMLMPLLLPSTQPPENGRFELIAMDVGQGSSVLVRTQKHLLVYDTGPKYGLDNDAGQRVLVPLLRARGDRQIDKLVLSHRDIDHVGGAATLLNALPVATLLSSLAPAHPLLTLGTPNTRCEAGQTWVWDSVKFEVLHPHGTDYEHAGKPNALSCVLKVTGKEGSALLTGDIEREQEAVLVTALGPTLKSDWLLVPHHGSRTSSTAAFLDAVQPTAAFIQAGYRNRFGHPVAEVLERLRERKITVHDSPSCGAWQGGGNAAVTAGTCERDIQRRYWHHLATASLGNKPLVDSP